MSALRALTLLPPTHERPGFRADHPRPRTAGRTRTGARATGGSRSRSGRRAWLVAALAALAHPGEPRRQV